MWESSSVSPSVSPSRSFDRRLLYREVVFVRMLLINDDIVLCKGVSECCCSCGRCIQHFCAIVALWMVAARVKGRWVAVSS
jgi:hypothetical protein